MLEVYREVQQGPTKLQSVGLYTETYNDATDRSFG